MENDATVFVVDPDEATRAAIRSLAYTMNLRWEGFASSQEFLEVQALARPACLVLEVRIPALNGLDIQKRLTAEGKQLPVIFLTSQATVSMAVRAMRAGAVHFLEKPVREHELWDAILEAIAVDEKLLHARRQRGDYERRVARLTSNEREILKMIAHGLPKQAIARELNVCIRTVEIRKNQLMKKLSVSSIMELVHFALVAGNGHWDGAAIPSPILQ